VIEFIFRLPLVGDRLSAFLPPGTPRSGLAHDSVAHCARLCYNLAGTPFSGQFPALVSLAARVSC
jgi:hypothetical protein